MKHKKQIIAVALGLPAAAVCAQVAIPCYVWGFTNCGALLANTDRVCDFGGMNLVCADVVTEDNTVSIVKGSRSGSAGYVNGDVANVEIQRRYCDEATQTCAPLGPPQPDQCTGEEPDETPCGAQSVE